MNRRTFRGANWPAAQAVAAALALSLGGLAAHGAVANFATPMLDKWMYENVDGTTGGQADVAPIFAILNTDDEDRLGSMMVGFNTAASIPTGLGAQNYQITSVKLTLTILTPNTFFYDSTHDSYRTSLPSSDPEFQADDTGKPIEVFGVGLRGGYTKVGAAGNPATGTYGETSPYGTTGQTPFRNAYPLGVNGQGTLFDVSDNVSQRQEANPFAVGKTSSVAEGALVPGETPFTFTLEITNPAVLAYIQSSLNSGVLALLVSSLHGASGQTGPQTYPRIYTKEGAFAVVAPEFAPQLEVQYTTVPEPHTAVLLLAAAGLFATGRTVRRRPCLS